MRIVFFKDLVHVLRIEFEVAADSVHPGLVHLVEAGFDDLSNFEVKKRYLFVEVHFDDVRNEKQGELHSLGLGIFLKVRGDVGCIRDILVQTGVCDLPLHFLEGGPQEESLEFIHHHYLDHFQHYLVERNTIQIGFLFPILADTFEQDVSIVGELAFNEAGVVLGVSFPVRLLHVASFPHSIFHDSLHQHIIHIILHQMTMKMISQKNHQPKPEFKDKYKLSIMVEVGL